MSVDDVEPIDIDGHKVDPRKADRFFHGSDGRRTTDAEWDEDRARAIAGHEGRIITPGLELRDTPPEDDEIAEAVL